MFHSSGHSKSRVKSSRRRMHYREDCFADDGGDDDDDDTDVPCYDPTDLSDHDCCECDYTRSQTDNLEASRRDRPRRHTSRRPSQVPCTVEPNSLPLARPIPLHFDASDVAWHNKSRKTLRRSGGENYQENRGDGAAFTVDSKCKTSPSPSPAPQVPPHPAKLARAINQTVARQSAVGIGAAAPSATTPRYYRRSTREASRRPSRLCLPVASQPDPALAGRRSGMHGSRSQPLSSGLPAAHKPPLAARAPSRHGAAKGTHAAEVKIPVQAHVSYVPRADDSPRSGSGTCAGRARVCSHQPRGEIRIPLDVFASPYLACAVDVEQWSAQKLKKPSAQRVRRSLTKAQPTRSHVTAQPLLVEHGSAQPLFGDRLAAPLHKRHSELGSSAAKPRAASDKPPQKHRTPSVRSRASDTPLPHAVQSNLDALLSTYEAQLSAPRAQRRSRCAAQTAPPRPTPPEQTSAARCLPRSAALPVPTVNPWGHRPDPRTIPPHLMSPRKPLSVRNREMVAMIESKLRALAEPRTMGNAQSQPVAVRAEAASAQTTAVGAQPTAHPPAQSPAPASQGASAAPAAAAAPAAPAAPAAAVAAPAASSAESRLTSLLTDLMNSGFDVAHLGVPTAKTDPTPTSTPTPPKSVEGSKMSPDPRGTYDALYNQQSLARVDFAEQIAACRVTTPAELMETSATKSGSRHKMDANADVGRSWQSGDELRRPHCKAVSECANYASQDDAESVFENQNFWDSLDLNVDLNSVQSLSDGFEGHEDSYKYFRDGQIPSHAKRVTSQTALLGESAPDDQRRANHGSLHELWRHTERRPSRKLSDKPVAEAGAQPQVTSGYCNWADYPGKARNDGLSVGRSREVSNGCRHDRRMDSTPATSQTGDVATLDADADDARRIRVSKSLIAEVVEETLERREKASASASASACKRVASHEKMNVVQALDLIKQMSTAKNDALCMEIAKALNDRLIDCESAKSEQEYVTQLKKLRSDHLRHISREVKRLQDLEGFLDDFGHVRTLYNACAHAARKNGEE